jgi:hypothetical protein
MPSVPSGKPNSVVSFTWVLFPGGLRHQGQKDRTSTLALFASYVVLSMAKGSKGLRKFAYFGVVDQPGILLPNREPIRDLSAHHVFVDISEEKQ